MKVLYFSPSPPPPIPDTDGLYNEIGYLKNFFGGQILPLSPFRSNYPILPVNLYGIQYLPVIRNFEREIDAYHVFFPYPANFHILRFLKKPVIFTVISGMLPDQHFRSTIPCQFVVSSEWEADFLFTKGITQPQVVRPGIDFSSIDPSPCPWSDNEFILLFGSAPWVKSQFESKGFDLILKVMKHLPQIRLICLWRGALYSEWRNRVKSSGLSDRVEIVREKGDISSILSRCHAAVVLATRPNLVKSFPNSLMEALTAGRPVIISRAIPMSYYVDETGCGKVAERFTPSELAGVIQETINEYSTLRKVAESVGKRDFSHVRMIREYGQLYREITE